jgi:hypothetical protein
MFECNREKFIKLKNISNAPSMVELQKFYMENSWRVNTSQDPTAFNCYEKLYSFYNYYKPVDSFNWLALLVFVPLLFGKR